MPIQYASTGAPVVHVAERNPGRHPATATHARPSATPHGRHHVAAHAGLQHGKPGVGAKGGAGDKRGPSMTDSKGGKYHLSAGGNKVYEGK